MMAKPIVLDQEWLERIATQVEGLEYGSVLITVHDGRVARSTEPNVNVSRRMQ